MKTITITTGLWGYVTHLSDWSGGKAAKAGYTPDGRHKLSVGIDEQILIPGVPDTMRRPSCGYGYVRPPETKGPDKVLWKLWDAMRLQRLDYYVALMNGSPDPQAVVSHYPEKLFIHGEGSERDSVMSRSEILKYLTAIDLPKAGYGFWHPVQIFTGLAMGFPVFRQGLKSDTDVGLTWYAALEHMRHAKLPANYMWDHFDGTKYGTLYIK